MLLKLALSFFEALTPSVKWTLGYGFLFCHQNVWLYLNSFMPVPCEYDFFLCMKKIRQVDEQGSQVGMG